MSEQFHLELPINIFSTEGLRLHFFQSKYGLDLSIPELVPYSTSMNDHSAGNTSSLSVDFLLDNRTLLNKFLPINYQIAKNPFHHYYYFYKAYFVFPFLEEDLLWFRHFFYNKLGNHAYQVFPLRHLMPHNVYSK